MPVVQTRRWSLLAIAVIACGAWTAAQPKPQTATEFYKSFRETVAKATKVEDIVPFMNADVKKQIESTPADQRPKMFEMMKMGMSMITDVKVVKEDHNPDGSATLSLTGLDLDKKPGKGTVKIVKEGGAWKVGQESWSS